MMSIQYDRIGLSVYTFQIRKGGWRTKTEMSSQDPVIKRRSACLRMFASHTHFCLVLDYFFDSAICCTITAVARRLSEK